MKDTYTTTDGSLFLVKYDKEKGFIQKHIRKDYALHYKNIKSGRQLRACLRAGKYTTFGGYQLVFVTNSGEYISFDSLKYINELKMEIRRIRDKEIDRIIGCEVYWEGPPVPCSISGEMIESVYGDPEE